MDPTPSGQLQPSVNSERELSKRLRAARTNLGCSSALLLAALVLMALFGLAFVGTLIFGIQAFTTSGDPAGLILVGVEAVVLMVGAVGAFVAMKASKVSNQNMKKVEGELRQYREIKAAQAGSISLSRALDPGGELSMAQTNQGGLSAPADDNEV